MWFQHGFRADMCAETVCRERKMFSMKKQVCFWGGILLYALCVLPFAHGASPYNVLAGIDTVSVRIGSYPIAAPLAGGPLRILWIGPGARIGYSCGQVTARLDCRFETVLTASRSRFVPDSVIAESDTLLDGDAQFTGWVLSLLAEHWDVVWLDYPFDRLPPPVRESLRERGKKGTGFVYIGDGRDLKPLSAKGSFDRTRLNAVEGPGQSVEYAGNCGSGIMLALPGPEAAETRRAIGDSFTRAVHALITAAGRGGFFITRMEKPGRRVEHESMGIMNYRLDFLNPGPDSRLEVCARYRDETGAVIADEEISYIFEHGKGFVRVPYPVLPVGEYSVDVSVLENGSVKAIGCTSFRVYSEDCLNRLELRKRQVETGGFVYGRIRTERELQDGMVIVAELVDTGGRRLDYTEILPAPRQIAADFILKANTPVGGVLRVRGALYKNNVLIHRIEIPVLARSGSEEERFRLSVLDTGPPEFWRVEEFQRLAETGVSRLALDLTGCTPDRAVRLVMDAAFSGLDIVPSFSVEIGADRGNEKNLLTQINAVMQALKGLGVRTCVLRAASGSGDDAEKPGDAFTGNLARRVAEYDSTLQVVVFDGTSPDDGGSRFTKASPRRMDWGGITVVPVNGAPDEARNVKRLRAMVWERFFAGADGVWWLGVSGNAGAALLPGSGVHPGFAAVAGDFRDIGAGIDVLIRGMDRWYDPVAILTGSADLPGMSTGDGQSALHRNGSEENISLSAETFRRLCVDSGYHPRMLTSGLVRNGALESFGIRVLILPGVQSLDRKTAAVIAAFLRNGGVAIADTRPEYTGRGDEGSLELTFSTPSGGAGVVSGTEAASESSQDNDSIRSHLLGFDIAKYQDWRQEKRGEQLRKFVTEKVRAAGVSPVFQSPPDLLGSGDRFLYRDENTVCIGYVPALEEQEVGLSALTPSMEMLGERVYLHDLRDGQFLGMLPDAMRKARSEAPTVYSLLRYRVSGIGLTVEPSVVRPGESLNCGIEVQVQAPSQKAGRHILSVRVIGPDGVERTDKGGKFETVDGLVQVPLFFSPSDPVGKWGVRVRDIMSGRSTEKTVIVMPRIGSL